MNLTIGTDPEFFVLHQHTGQYISAHDLIEGTKKEPYRVPFGAIQVDGVAAEINTNPAETAVEFSNNIINVTQTLQNMLLEKNKNYRLRAIPVVHFSKKYFNKLPSIAKELGCEPDYNAYTGKPNPSPVIKSHMRFMRSGGGHLHVGWTEHEDPADPAHIKDCVDTVEQYDCVLYPLSQLWDTSHERRQLYGKIGSYRPKSYGVEYRPLSNVFLSDPDLHEWVFTASSLLSDMLDGGMNLKDDKEVLLVRDHLLNHPNAKLKPDVLVDYHNFLVKAFDLPSLPEAYLNRNPSK